MRRDESSLSWLLLLLAAQLAASLDIEAAYRTIPCAPEHKRFIVIFFDGRFYLDHNLPFGIASVAGLQGEVASATLRIWRALDVHPAKKWVDNISIFRFPSACGQYLGISCGEVYRYEYGLTLAHIKYRIAPLVVPWHREKGQLFDDTVEYLGFLWDVPERHVNLTATKRRKYIVRLSPISPTFIPG